MQAGLPCGTGARRAVWISPGGKPCEFRQCPEQDQAALDTQKMRAWGLQRDGFIQGASRRHHEGGFSLESGEGAAPDLIIWL